MKAVTITICNWEKYNARADVKHPTWFRLDNDAAASQALFGLKAEERWVWVALLGQASQKATPKGTFEIDLDWFAWYSGAPEKVILVALKKLGTNQAVTYAHVRTRTDADVSDRERTDLYATDRQTDITDRQTDTLTFDFESVYKNYPRKIGKTKGIEKCEKLVETQQDFDRLTEAITKFAEHHERLKTEEQYIPYFSTFMSQWEDWLDPTTGTSAAPSGIGGDFDWEYVFGRKKAGSV